MRVWLTIITGQLNSNFCMFPLQIEMFLTNSSMLISEMNCFNTSHTVFEKQRTHFSINSVLRKWFTGFSLRLCITQIIHWSTKFKILSVSFTIRRVFKLIQACWFQKWKPFQHNRQRTKHLFFKQRTYFSWDCELRIHSLNLNTTEDLCWCFVVTEEMWEELKECERNRRNVRGTGGIW